MRKLSIIGLMVLATGCVIGDEDTGITCVLTTLTLTTDYPGSEDEQTFYYITYENGKAIQMDYSESSGEYGVYTVEYDGDKISEVVLEVFYPDPFLYTYEFLYEGKQLTERKIYRLEGESFDLLARDKFTYNDKDQLVTRDYYNASNTKYAWSEYVYSGSSTNPSQATFYPQEETYQYTYSSKKNPLRQWTMLSGSVTVFTKEITKIVINDVDGYVTTVNYDTEYNTDKYAEKLTASSEDSDIISIFEFEYECEE